MDTIQIEFIGVKAQAPGHNQIVIHHGDNHIVLSPCKAYEKATHAIVCDYDKDDWIAWKWYVDRKIPLYAEGAICEALKHEEIGKHLIPFTKPIKIGDLRLHVLKAPVAPRQPAAGVMLPQFKVCIVPELPPYISQALIKAFGYPPKHIIVGIGSYEKPNHKISFKDFKEQIKRVLQPPEKGILSLTLTNFRKDLVAHKSTVLKELRKIFPDIPIIWAKKGMVFEIGRDGQPFEIIKGKSLSCPLQRSIRKLLHLEEFRSEGVDYDIQHAETRWKELIADARYLGNSAYPRLKMGKKWGNWTLADVKKYFAKIIDTLRSRCKFPWIPPFGKYKKIYKEYYGRDPNKAAKSSFWQLYKEAEKYMQTKPPATLEEAKEWDKERKSIIKTKSSLKPGWYSDVKPKYRFEIDIIESDLAHLGWDKKTLLVDPKWDGLRLTIGKINGKGFAWVDPEDLKERSPDVTDRVPEIIKEIETYWPDNTICDAELITMDFPEVLHRTVTNAVLRTKEPAENFIDYVYAAVFDIMYFKGKEVEHKPLSERMKILKEIPLSAHIIVERVSEKIEPGGFAYICNSPKEVRQAWNLIINDKAVKFRGEYIQKGAEGVMIKLWQEDTRAKQQNPAWCLKGDTYILTDEGFRMIKTIKPGDRVLCADGKFHRVKRVFKKPFDGREIYEIKGGIPKARVTHDHLLLTKHGWLEAENIKDTSILVRPDIKEEITEKFPEEITLEIFGYKKTIKLDYEMMKAIGFILAEGQLTTGKTHKYHNQSVVVRINPEVTEYKWFKEIIESRLGISVDEIKIKDKNIVHLEFRDPPFASWIHETFVSKYGRNFPGKAVRIKLPLSLANAKVEQIKGLIEGFWLGDGMHSNDSKGLRISTSSSYFAGTLYLICRLRGWDATVSYRKTRYNGEEKRDSWVVYIKTDGSIQRKPIKIENIGTQNFGKCGRIDYLYDLEIEGADNYSNGEVVFHNSKCKIFRECDLVVLGKHTVKGTTSVFNYYLGIDITPEYAAKLLDDKKLKKWVVALDEKGKLITGVTNIRNLLKKKAKVRYFIYYGKSDNTKIKLDVGDVLRVASEEVIRYENEAHPEAPLFRGYINRAMEPIPEKDVSDSLDVFNRLSLLEPKRVPIEELMRWHQESIKEKKFKGRGLYLPAPHAELIYAGKKVLVLKDRKYNIGGEVFLIFDHDKAYGYAMLGKPIKINTKTEFINLQPLHKVTEEEFKKYKWKLPVYAYPVVQFMPFSRPKKMKVPRGVQNFLLDAADYIVEESSLPSIAFLGERPVEILTEKTD